MKKEVPLVAPAKVKKDASSHDRGRVVRQKAEGTSKKRENNQYVLTVQTTYFRPPFFKPVRNNERAMTVAADREETD